MQDLNTAHRIIRILTGTNMFLVMLLVGFQVLPWFQGSDSQYITQAGLQRTRSQAFVSAALTLVSRPFAEKTQALSNLQVALPLFEQEQATLLANPMPTIQLFVTQARPDYLALVAAVHALLANPNTINQVDPIQVNIIVAHASPFSVTITSIITALQQQIDARTANLFIIEVVIALLILVSKGGIYLLTNHLVHAIRSAGGNQPTLREVPRKDVS